MNLVSFDPLSDPILFAVFAFGVTFSGISKGGFGSAAAFVPAALLASFIEPMAAMSLMLPLLMVMDIGSLKPYWRRWMAVETRVLCLGAVPGVILGVLLFQMTNANNLRFVIGAICLAFVLWQTLPQLKKHALHRSALSKHWGMGLGALAGFTSFVSHAGGPAAAVYLLSQRPNKTEYQATTVIVFWIINIAKAVPYAFLGLFSLETLSLSLLFAPFALIGVYLGVKWHFLISERVFFALTYGLLLCTGLRLISVSISGS